MPAAPGAPGGSPAALRPAFSYKPWWQERRRRRRRLRNLPASRATSARRPAQLTPRTAGSRAPARQPGSPAARQPRSPSARQPAGQGACAGGRGGARARGGGGARARGRGVGGRRVRGACPRAEGGALAGAARLQGRAGQAWKGGPAARARSRLRALRLGVSPRPVSPGSPASDRRGPRPWPCPWFPAGACGPELRRCLQASLRRGAGVVPVPGGRAAPVLTPPRPQQAGRKAARA